MATCLRALTPVLFLLCLAWAGRAGALQPKPAPDPFADLFAPGRSKASPPARRRPNLARLHRQPKGGAPAQPLGWSRLQPVTHAHPEAGELLLSDYAPGRHALAGP